MRLGITMAMMSLCRSVADELHEAAARGASLSELMDILDDSCFDGDICEFLQDNTIPCQ